jgi:hypothetical protein
MQFRRSTFIWLLRLAATVIAPMSFSLAVASPMLYTGTVVTDIRVGGTLYQQASVSITFIGNTKDISPVVVPGSTTELTSYTCSSPGYPGYSGDGSGYFSYLTKGNAIVSVSVRGHTLTARLEPDQVFVALDSCNGGIGFGSFTGPGGLEPAYPLGLTFGTARIAAVKSGLTVPRSMSGNAWSCIGYPPTGSGNLPATANGQCTPPDGAPAVPGARPGKRYPLLSDKGEIFFYMPYFVSDSSGLGNWSGSLNRGTFTIAPFADD